MRCRFRQIRHHVKCSAEFIMRHQFSFSEHYIDEIYQVIDTREENQTQYYKINYDSEPVIHEPAGYNQRHLGKESQIQIALYKLSRRSYSPIFRHKNYPAGGVSQR